MAGLKALVVLIVPFILVFGSSLDIFLLGFFSLLRNRDAIPLSPAAVIGIAKVGAALFTFLQILRYFIGLKEKSSPTEGFAAKPMIFPCRTSHTRLLPKPHSFSYSYLWVGIPVGWEGSVGGMLSSEDRRDSSPWYMRLISMEPAAWYTVNSDDYLGRGHVDGGLEEKLQNYLKSKNMDPNEYPYAYLLTAPRFLGYASNPVSIWNLYSQAKELKAFILEVNNTFDERHIYFVKPDLVSDASATAGSAAPPKLVNTWPKDFYVSTFNSRAGNYSISATDPLFPSMNNPGVVNTTIALKSVHVSLIARIYSAAPALDPSTMTLWSKTKFLLSWWWVGLATFPRTIVQALSLLLKRKMSWVFRPEPRRDTIPRHADATEIVVESVFRKYLRSLVENCNSSIIMDYSPAGLVHGGNETVASPSAQPTASNDKTNTLEFKVLTPAFYSRFLHYTGDSIQACIHEQESATLTISNPNLLNLLSKSDSPRLQEPFNAIQNPRFWAIQNLRTSPSPIAYTATSAPTSPTVEKAPEEIVVKNESSPAQLSQLESFILKSCSAEEKSEYASKVLKLFISEQIAFGWMELLDLEFFLVRSRAAWLIAGWLVRR